MINNLIKRLEAGKSGSALIMTIVLTVLLAIVAVMFVAVARMDRASTSNIADNKTLDLAAKSIVEIINKELINDVPNPSQEYYDYPDANNAWLASIEPYKSGTDYYWRQISDVTGFLKNKGFETNDVDVNVPGVIPKVVKEYPDITLTNGELNQLWADADGDGIADSKWIEVNDTTWSMRSSKGQRIYAAVRVIDNGGMVNINTAHSFDANSTDTNEIDGSRQMQINLQGLLKPPDTNTISNLHDARCGSEPNDWPDYEKNVIWNYNNVPDGNYLPFDISDELELKYRYCIDSKFVSRFEFRLPETAEGAGDRNFGNLYDGSDSNQPYNPCKSNWRLRDWQRRITEFDDCKADRRHLLTTYNYDRVIDPYGARMFNINDANVNNVNTLYNKIRAVIPDGNTVAQIAVNIIDYRDSDSNITIYPKNGKNYYGFETPCAYISELVYRQVTDSNTSTKYKSYAIELYKPYPADIGPNSTWQVRISNPSTTVFINNWTGPKSYYVIKWETPQALLDVNTSDANTQDEGIGDGILAAGSTISLTRNVGSYVLVVDSVVVPVDWSSVADGDYSVPRDINNPNKCIRRLWDSTGTYTPMLGKDNGPIVPEEPATSYRIQAHPANGDFTNIGQIGMIFRKPAYYKLGDPNTGVIGYGGVNQSEPEVRLDLADANNYPLFKYLTVWPRSGYALGPNATIKGRININTAPAFVIAQLPWVSYRPGSPADDNDPNIAKAIVAYRDKMKNQGINDPNYKDRPGPAGFENIGQLCDVNSGAADYSIRYYGRKDGPAVGDQLGFPDINNDPPSSGDGAADDFEERDLIFARISDLVTVRSDVFTAYILVRVGTEGPQKRYMVIFDRSQVRSPSDRVGIIAFHSVPEAR